MPLPRRTLIFFILFIIATNKENITNSSTEQEEQPSIPKKVYLSQIQQLKLQERNKKLAINIETKNYELVNFKLDKSTEFILKSQAEQKVKITFDAYWSQKNLYLQANIAKNQQISVNILQNNTLILQQLFYTTTGLQFNALPQINYRIIVTSQPQSKQLKMLQMKISQVIEPQKSSAKKQGMQDIQDRILSASRKLTNGIRIASLGSMMEEKITRQTLLQTSLYSYFQIFEALLIALVSWVEVKFLIRLLKSDIVV